MPTIEGIGSNLKDLEEQLQALQQSQQANEKRQDTIAKEQRELSERIDTVTKHRLIDHENDDTSSKEAAIKDGSEVLVKEVKAITERVDGTRGALRQQISNIQVALTGAAKLFG